MNTNKKIIRSESKVGTFTTVNYKILRDDNLTPISKLLMIEITSDSDEFKLSQSLYCKRLNIDRKQFQRAIIDLIKNGYIRRKDISKPNKVGVKSRPIYHYTVSEYGNLKSKEITTPTVIEVKIKEEKISSNIPTKEQGENFISWVDGLDKVKKDYLSTIITDNIFDDYSEMRRVGKIVKNYVAPVEEIENIDLQIKNRVLDIISKSDIKGTIAQVKSGTNKIVSSMIELNKTNPELINDKKIKEKIIYHNNNIVNEKTRNLNQITQN